MSQLFSLSATVEGVEEMRRGILSMADAIDDLTEPLLKSRGLMMKEIEKQHRTSGSEFGNKWQRLNPVYEAKKIKKWGRKPILTASGTMRRGYVSRMIMNSEVVIWNKISYFPKHQRGQGSIPQRRMLLIDGKRAKMIEAIFSKYIDKKAIKEGWRPTR